MTKFIYKPISNKKQMGGRRDKGDIKFIVIHYTGNTSKGANADAHYRYLQNATRYGSAHYYVDDNNIIQCIGDSITAWSVGDNQGYGNALNGCTNYNSISVEMCVNSDGDFNKTLFNTIELTKELIRNFPNARVCRHYDVTRKNCPAMMSGKNNAKWNDFLKEITKNRRMIIDISKTSDCKMVNGNSVKVTGWEKDGADWYYKKGGKHVTGWLEYNKHWFYFIPETGKMKRGWLEYCNKDGKKSTFYFDENGYMLTGQQTIEGKKYLFDEKGYLKR